MLIKFKTSDSFSEEDWSSYTDAFNQAFKREYTIDYFKQKYLITIDGFSYHCFLLDENKIVGACNIIPFSYIVDNSPFRVGLVVDVFILPEYREDPYSLFKMYKLLKTELSSRNIAFTIAVPNDIVYPFWKSIVKWKDIGILPYYALPVKLGNLLGKFRAPFNFINNILIEILLVVSQIVNTKEPSARIHIDRSVPFLEKHRYADYHKTFKYRNSFLSYRIMNEHGVLTCYLIDFYNLDSSKRDSFSLRRAISKIIKEEKIDLIIFVGQLKMTQFMLFKVPFKREPKHLYLMTDIINPSLVIVDEIQIHGNWDFGIFNFDVR